MFNLQMINEWIVTWFFAALIYDEKNIKKYAKEILGLKFDFTTTKDGSEFFGIAIDEKKGIAYLPYRGTDGYTKMGKIKSWMNNLKISTSGDGVEDGAQEMGNNAFNKYKKRLYNVRKANLGGHSKGGMVINYEGCLIAENIKNIEITVVDTYGNPPTGDCLFEKRFKKHEAEKKLYGRRWAMPGDKIATKWFRGKNKPFNGKDVGIEMKLNPIIIHKLGPIDLINHSCRIYHAAIKDIALSLYLKDNVSVNKEDLKLLNKMDNLIVN